MMWENHHEFRDQDILPFVGKPTFLDQGAFGEIYMINVLASQQNLFPVTANDNKDGHVQVVKKIIKSQSQGQDWHRERTCLRLLNQLQHPNIIQLLGSYTHKGDHNFLFPFIDMNLKTFFASEQAFGDFGNKFVFFSALRGLASALSKTHQLHLDQANHGLNLEAIGYHHDLRPKNILVSKRTFILADFGFGRIRSQADSSITPVKSTRGDYIAPECTDENEVAQDVTRAIDVWAFGCVLADVITYMMKGKQGVQDFSDRRQAPGRLKSWHDSLFYQPDGDLKAVVRIWLTGIAESARSSLYPVSSLIELAFMILQKNPAQRPTMTNICISLSYISLKAHFEAILNELDSVMHLSSSDARLASENFWFMKNRFCAFGYVSAIDQESVKLQIPSLAEDGHDESISTMVSLFHTLREVQHMLKTPISETNDNSKYELQGYEAQIGQCIEQLWDLLPTSKRTQAIDVWHQKILDTELPKDLDTIYQKRLKSRYMIYDIAGAMCMMKKFSLAALHPETFESRHETRMILAKDITQRHEACGHLVGLHQGKEHVVVEKLEPSKGGLNQKQGQVVLDLKAKSLSFAPKTDAFGALDCIGCLDRKGTDLENYGLVYRFPAWAVSDPSTLLQLLLSTKHQPPLEEKFKLAFALANFLKEFHTVGWLHENFNAHNVLLFSSGTAYEWQKPCIVGLHKARPDGSFWQTDGPRDSNLQDYQHPSYINTRRYQLKFDCYSLSVVLLEIGLWRALKTLLSGEKFQSMGGEEIRKSLLSLCRNQLPSKMGTKYANLTQQCMDGGLEVKNEHLSVGGDVTGKSDIRMAEIRRFADAVVEPLRNLSLAPI
ncbi:unnamed protein product [Clonostachys rhizophaga]|uniref:Protein kinase domain-containing protein n=1 Tax=Clonostachys rhizophaga TaxID=160324 RepID=A0A9N9VPA7_9HYPO|nr:unnamed protein product [Clonostachys rhizophaga]